MSLLDVRQLTTRFHTRRGVITAVDSVSFDVAAGETLGIVGESGSGKSVACYSLLGLVPSPPGRVESGSAMFAGRDLLRLPPRELRRVRGGEISMIFQDPMTSLNPNLSIAKQLEEQLLWHGKVTRRQARARSIAALEEVGIRDAAQRIGQYPHEFSGGQRQRIMIAMALLNEPKLLIADEPTTALDVTVQAQILKLLDQLKRSHNLAVIFISHDLAVVSQIAQRIVVMQRGRVVETGSAEQIFTEPRETYTQQLLAAIPARAKPTPDAAQRQAPPLLQLRGVSKTYHAERPWWRRSLPAAAPTLRGIELDVYRGEILGLVGESGSGKSTLGRCVVRLTDADGGEVRLGDLDLLALRGEHLRRARRHFQMIFQDPFASLNPRMTVYDALAEPLLLHGLATKAELPARIAQLLAEVGLTQQQALHYPHEFSGGQRQRIAIARALAAEPELIVADEPVSALDVTIQAQILDLLLKLNRERGLTLLFISHDMGVVRYVCDRVAVLKGGEIVELESTETIFREPRHSYTQSLLAAVPRLLKA